MKTTKLQRLRNLCDCGHTATHFNKSNRIWICERCWNIERRLPELTRETCGFRLLLDGLKGHGANRKRYEAAT